MAEQLKHRAKIKARGLDNTGVTEDHARAMAAGLGRYTMFVVEGVADTVVTDSEGNQQVTIRLTQVEPVPEQHEDRVRELARSLSKARKVASGELTLPGTEEPTASLETALDDATAIIERDDQGEPVGMWDGNPDAPPPSTTETVTCPYAGCELPDEHDGDHSNAATDEDAEPETCDAPGCQLEADHTGAHVLGSAAARDRKTAKKAAGG